MFGHHGYHRLVSYISVLLRKCRYNVPGRTRWRWALWVLDCLWMMQSKWSSAVSSHYRARYMACQDIIFEWWLFTLGFQSLIDHDALIDVLIDDWNIEKESRLFVPISNRLKRSIWLPWYPRLWNRAFRVATVWDVEYVKPENLNLLLSPLYMCFEYSTRTLFNSKKWVVHWQQKYFYLIF